jgi:transposase-like protein
VKGHWCYLYRAIDQFGNLIDVRLSKTRDLQAAEAFFKQSLQTVGHTPEKVTTDKHTHLLSKSHSENAGKKGEAPDQPVSELSTGARPSRNQAEILSDAGF